MGEKQNTYFQHAGVKIEDNFLTLIRGQKPKNKLPEEASTLIKVVFTLDAMRVGVFHPELRNLHQKLRETHFLSTGGASWGAIRREINEVINLPEKSQKMIAYVRWLPILNILLMLGFVITGLSAAVGLYLLHQPLYIFLFPPLGFLLAVSLFRWYFEESVRTFYERNKAKSEKLRRINNQVIKRMVFVLDRASYPLKECTFAVYNADYENIAVKKKPRLYRGFYEVYPVASSLAK